MAREELFGELRSANRGTHNLFTQETNMIRPVSQNAPPKQTAIDVRRYNEQKNNTLASMYVGGTVHNHRKIIRPSLFTRFRLGVRPSPGNRFGKLLANDPTAWSDYQTNDYPTENKIWLYRDQFGPSGGAPVQGSSYVWPASSYYGNPWGVGGQLYSHLRQGGQQNDFYLAPYKNTPSKKKVTFNFSK